MIWSLTEIQYNLHNWQNHKFTPQKVKKWAECHFALGTDHLIFLVGEAGIFSIGGGSEISGVPPPPSQVYLNGTALRKDFF
jgi:alpha-tubulin suppressor-like RCC1 family protein